MKRTNGKKERQRKRMKKRERKREKEREREKGKRTAPGSRLESIAYDLLEVYIILES